VRVRVRVRARARKTQSTIAAAFPAQQPEQTPIAVADPCSFSKAFATLLELGVPTSQFASEPWSMGK
jgi:hypothetical protein